MIWLLLLLPLSEPHETHVDVCEANHVVCPTTGTVNTYWLWWNYYPYAEHPGYHVRAWRRYDEVPRPVNGVQEWWDVRTKRQQRVVSRVQHDTWTWFDREINDRREFPEQMRRGL